MGFSHKFSYELCREKLKNKKDLDVFLLFSSLQDHKKCQDASFLKICTKIFEIFEDLGEIYPVGVVKSH